MSEDLVLKMCHDIGKWVNHTKEGPPRRESDLSYFDRLWSSISISIIELQKKKSILCDEDIDFINMLKYEGTLYRIHKKYKKKADNYGVIQTPHYVSWTKTTNFDDIYWLYKTSDFLTITAKTSSELFAIDLQGFSDYVKKYYYPNYSIGTPALMKEQEVVFPIIFSTIQDITPRKWIN